MKNNASLIYSLALVVGDFFSLVAAFISAFVLRVSISDKPIAHQVHAITYFKIFVILLPFWILIFALLGLYNSTIYEKRFKELGLLSIGSFIGLLFVLAYAYVSNAPVFPAKLVPVYGFALGFLLLVLIRNLIRTIRILLFSYDVGITKLLVVGDTKIAQELVESLADSRVSGYKVVGVVGAKSHTHEHFKSLRIFSNFQEVIDKLHPEDIHSIVQTELYADGEKNNEVLEYAQTRHIAYRFIPGNTELFVGNIDVELFRSSLPVISVHPTSLIGWGRIIKRFTDLILGGLAFLIFLPFMVVIGLLVKILDPRGPVFYKVGRLSRYGNTVNICKFRSMKQAYNGITPEEAFTKMGRPELIKAYRENGDYLPNDPRISAFGRFIRRWSLDELPQLWNIIKGDISLVGPRALEAYELNQFAKKDLILAVKSGLTGLAQVSGRRDITFEERRKLDLFYVQNWTIWLDITILIKTIRVVLERNGAQ
jgi:exopolysaccharide biosynthesis polyprenyl glycosylphosphotransferase